MIKRIRLIRNRSTTFWCTLLIAWVITLAGWVHLQSAYLEIETSLQRGGTQQVFLDTGSGFHEEASHRVLVEHAFATVRYRIAIDQPPLLQLRLDPADTAGWVKFRRCHLKPSGWFLPQSLIREGLPHSGVRDIVYLQHERTWTITSEYGNTDPHVILSNLPAPVSGAALLRKMIPAGIAAVVLSVLLAGLVETALLRNRFFPAVGACLRWVCTTTRSRHVLAGLGLLTATALTVLLLAIRPERQAPMLQLTFEWSGYPVEYLQLDYDVGDGFRSHQSRLFWNKEARSELSLHFRIPANNLTRLRLLLPADSDTGRISNMVLEDRGGRIHIPMDLSQWETSEELRLFSRAQKHIEFASDPHRRISLQSPALSSHGLRFTME